MRYWSKIKSSASEGWTVVPRNEAPNNAAMLPVALESKCLTYVETHYNVTIMVFQGITGLLYI